MDLAPGSGTTGSTAEYVNGYILIIGGKVVTKDCKPATGGNYRRLNEADLSDDVLIYSIADNNWKSASCFPMKLAYHVACSYQNFVYVSGGYIPAPNGEDAQLS